MAQERTVVARTSAQTHLTAVGDASIMVAIAFARGAGQSIWMIGWCALAVWLRQEMVRCRELA